MLLPVVDHLHPVLGSAQRAIRTSDGGGFGGIEPAGGSPEDLARYLKDDYGKWGKVIRSVKPGER